MKMYLVWQRQAFILGDLIDIGANFGRNPCFVMRANDPPFVAIAVFQMIGGEGP